jgi:hypothetical protein
LPSFSFVHDLLGTDKHTRAELASRGAGPPKEGALNTDLAGPEKVRSLSVFHPCPPSPAIKGRTTKVTRNAKRVTDCVSCGGRDGKGRIHRFERFSQNTIASDSICENLRNLGMTSSDSRFRAPFHAAKNSECSTPHSTQSPIPSPHPPLHHAKPRNDNPKSKNARVPRPDFQKYFPDSELISRFGCA